MSRAGWAVTGTSQHSTARVLLSCWQLCEWPVWSAADVATWHSIGQSPWRRLLLCSALERQRLGKHTARGDAPFQAGLTRRKVNETDGSQLSWKWLEWKKCWAGRNWRWSWMKGIGDHLELKRIWSEMSWNGGWKTTGSGLRCGKLEQFETRWS